jgi:hypothetical protein
MPDYPRTGQTRRLLRDDAWS